MLKIVKEKNLTGGIIEKLVDAFTPLIDELKKKREGSNGSMHDLNPKDGSSPTEKKKEKLPDGWKGVTSPSGESFFFNTKTDMVVREAPEICVSDMPFSEFKGRPSALDIFQRMPPNFYEPLDKAFGSAKFENLADIRKKSQSNAGELAADGTLAQLGMSKDEAEVLFSYTYEAENGKDSPCYIMNRVLAERDVNRLRMHRSYVLHLLKALRKLKPILR